MSPLMGPPDAKGLPQIPRGLVATTQLSHPGLLKGQSSQTEGKNRLKEALEPHAPIPKHSGLPIPWDSLPLLPKSRLTLSHLDQPPPALYFLFLTF